MRAVLTSLGSMGDIQPILALAAEMARAEHKVSVALSPNYASRVESLGLPFIPIGPPMHANDVRSMIAQQTAMPVPADQARHFIEAIIPHVPEMFQQLCECCHNADVLISTPHQIAARMAHDAVGVKYVTVHLAHFGALGACDLKLATAPIINSCRLKLGLHSLDDPLTKDAASPQLALYAVTGGILKRFRNWPDHHQVTGYFFLDDDSWLPPDELMDFLAAGPAPAVISFSSMMHADPKHIADLLLDAIEQTKLRAIILDGWSDLTCDRRLPPSVMRMRGFIPHAWLFPRASCVVHHGGAGTTAAALRAGVPAVIVPHMLDQPIWAELARALGCAGAVIPIQQLSADKLAAGIISTTRNPAFKSAAKRIALNIAKENGVAVALNLITEFVSQLSEED